SWLKRRTKVSAASSHTIPRAHPRRYFLSIYSGNDCDLGRLKPTQVAALCLRPSAEIVRCRRRVRDTKSAEDSSMPLSQTSDASRSRKSVANIGRFFSYRAAKEYVQEIWQIVPIPANSI